MSQAVREEISAAVSTVAGVSCLPYYRSSPGAGDASIRLAETNYPNRFGGIVTWEVVIGLPQDVATAEKWIDARAAEIRAAVADAMTVRRIYPARSTYDTTQTNVLIVEGTREED